MWCMYIPGERSCIVINVISMAAKRLEEQITEQRTNQQTTSQKKASRWFGEEQRPIVVRRRSRLVHYEVTKVSRYWK